MSSVKVVATNGWVGCPGIMRNFSREEADKSHGGKDERLLGTALHSRNCLGQQLLKFRSTIPQAMGERRVGSMMAY
jgi:hypothetical protein